MLDCRKGGKYFYKRDRGFYQYERPNFLAVEDPQDLGNDLAKGSYAVDKAWPLYLPANTWLKCLHERPQIRTSWCSYGKADRIGMFRSLLQAALGAGDASVVCIGPFEFRLQMPHSLSHL